MHILDGSGYRSVAVVQRTAICDGPGRLEVRTGHWPHDLDVIP